MHRFFRQEQKGNIVPPLQSRLTPLSGPISLGSLSRERPECDSGAEGATTPETLRQKDRAGLVTLESSRPSSCEGGSPTEQGSLSGFGISQAQGQRGCVIRRNPPGAPTRDLEPGCPISR